VQLPSFWAHRSDDVYGRGVDIRGEDGGDHVARGGADNRVARSGWSVSLDE
jgi:hypothetical protein